MTSQHDLPESVGDLQFCSLGVLTMDSRLRRNAVWLSSHLVFEYTYTLLVLLSVLAASTGASVTVPVQGHPIAAQARHHRMIV